jgi:hypothetical protein
MFGIETTAKVEVEPRDGGDESGADRTSGSWFGRRVKGTRREPDETTEARVLGL